jgi:hypothetical protein
MEGDEHRLRLEHETMLDTLYRNRDRVALESAQHTEMLQRRVTSELESNHERRRSLAENRQAVQNKMVRLLRVNTPNTVYCPDTALVTGSSAAVARHALCTDVR